MVLILSALASQGVRGGDARGLAGDALRWVKVACFDARAGEGTKLCPGGLVAQAADLARVHGRRGWRWASRA